VLTVDGLEAFWEYRVNVNVTTKDGNYCIGVSSDVELFTTAEDS